MGLKFFIFYLAFALLFLIGGFINYFGILPFKMAFVPLLSLILIPFFKVKLNPLLVFSILYFLIISLSGIINNTPFILVLLYYQFSIIPFLITYLSYTYLNSTNIKKVFKVCILVSIIQLPVILIQRFFYNELSKLGARNVISEDFSFGTFYTSNDPALAFFLFGVIIFLLFEDSRNKFIKNRFFIIFWVSLTILLLNSKISIFILMLIFGYYLIYIRKIKFLLILIFTVPILFTILWHGGLDEHIDRNISGFLHHLDQLDSNNMNEAQNSYLEGKGNRVFALLYLSTQKLSLIGGGPYSSFDPFSNKFKLGGDSGHLINTYINLGILGFIVSYLLIFSFLANKPITRAAILYFFVLLIFTLTVDLFIDPSIILAFHIFTSSYLIPVKQEFKEMNYI